ncbi:hypothetical protein BM536_005000 [Streptomyces phaeoluteigriseus]|uniref:Uncharacterized protein n=1 Tax=Streptomyces phaeoluteigriseus TaxID=114686 RepID=A0A1V6MY09_9ACTN|nr:hypothetical protein [Streptomyces phaeoluteigriseus]OQD57338.1 hypothetical protein BM536_005000 [Streptomyces phaeoluteigriseus]
MAELAEAFSPVRGRPKWLQEFGASPVERPAESIPQRFLRPQHPLLGRHVGLHMVGIHDIDRRFTGFVEYQFDLGLLTVDNEIKATGARLQELIKELRNAPVRPATRSVALVLPDSPELGLHVADRFFALVDDGVRPALVTSERADDAAQLCPRHH